MNSHIHWRSIHPTSTNKGKPLFDFIFPLKEVATRIGIISESNRQRACIKKAPIVLSLLRNWTWWLLNTLTLMSYTAQMMPTTKRNGIYFPFPSKEPINRNIFFTFSLSSFRSTHFTRFILISVLKCTKGTTPVSTDWLRYWNHCSNSRLLCKKLMDLMLTTDLFPQSWTPLSLGS